VAEFAIGVLIPKGVSALGRRRGFRETRTSQALMKLPLRLSVQLQRGLGPNAILL
jgi:hypothetical protein